MLTGEGPLDWTSAGCWLVLAAGVSINLAAVVLALFRLRGARPPTVRRRANATLILPLTGKAPNLKRLVKALNRQTLVPRRLIFAVESADDPAYARALAVRPKARFPTSIVTAGRASTQGQKCRNQQAALATLTVDDDVIVLMDGDICPQKWWLSALASPIAEGRFDLVGGRRWQRVEAGGLAPHLVAAIDRGINLLPQFEDSSWLVVWGGSAALSRQAAAAIDLERVLDRTLSDDLSLADAARAGGLRVLIRGALLVPSPCTMRLSEAWRFGRRQYQICRIYRPGVWGAAAAAVHLRLLAWTAGLAEAPELLPMGSLGAMATLGLVRQLLVAEIARRSGVPDPLHVRAVQAVLGAAQPFVDLFHASIILGAAWTRVVSWSHVDYFVDGSLAIRIKERRAFAGSGAVVPLAQGVTSNAKTPT